MNKNGEVVARSLNNDPFGGAELDLAAAGIDHVEVQATKTTGGALQNVIVTMRATEQLAAATVTAGTRLAVVDTNGDLVRTATPTSALADPYTVSWTLTASAWTTLTDPTAVTVNSHDRKPVSLSIAATNTLRATVWPSDIPIMPPPDWITVAQPVHTSNDFPVEVRQSLTTLTDFVTALPAGATKGTLSYDIPNLGTLASDSNASVDQLVAATFQAQPFAEPMSKKFYVRERWYDPYTGSWLTPDPLGYAGGLSNLYSAMGGDPVNGRDPMGLEVASGVSGTIVISDPENPTNQTIHIPRGWALTHKLMVLKILVGFGHMDSISALKYMESQGIVIKPGSPEVAGALALTMHEVDGAIKELAVMYAATAAGMATGGAATAVAGAVGATTFTATTVGAFTAGAVQQCTAEALQNGSVNPADCATAGATAAVLGWGLQAGALGVKKIGSMRSAPGENGVGSTGGIDGEGTAAETTGADGDPVDAQPGKMISRGRQARHVVETSEWLQRGQPGYMLSVSDAQKVLDAYHSGQAQIIGITKTGKIVVEVDDVVGFYSDPKLGIVNEPTHRFLIKGTTKVSIVPTRSR